MVGDLTNLCVLFLLLLLLLLSAAADANSSFLHLSPGLNFTISASSLTVATPILDEAGLFFPILSSPSFNSSANSPSFNITSPFGFSLGFYLISSDLNAELPPFDPCSYGCNTYMAVCAGSLGNVTSFGGVAVDGALKNDSIELSPYLNRTVGGIAAPVWIANLDSPIRYVDEASLRVVADSKGGSLLQLSDGENVVWQVPINVADTMEMQSNGNLLIYSSSNRSHPVWQSSPNTDLLAQGQSLAVGKELVSNDSSYVARMEKGGLVFYMNKTLFNNERPSPYWLFPLYIISNTEYSPANESLNQLISSARCSNSPALLAATEFLLLYPGSCSNVSFLYPASTAVQKLSSSWVLWRLENDGMLYCYTLVSSLNDNGVFGAVSVTKNPLVTYSFLSYGVDYDFTPLFLEWQECNVPMACGPLGVCTPGAPTVCSCPEGLQPKNNSDIFPGCKRLIDLPNCTFGKGHTGSTDFVQLDSIASILLFNEWTFNSTPGDVNTCKKSCSFDCSCNGFFYEVNKSSCFFITDEITLLTVVDKNYASILHPLNANNTDFQSLTVFARDYVTFLKVASGNKNSKGKSISTAALIALSAILSSAVVCLVLGMAIYLYRARRKKYVHTSKLSKEESKELQDILPLLPSRFSYKDLFEATRGFNTLLGAGGCGSVYAGVLPDGRKVAVKVLQVVLQGTGHSKQFLAEIATIGRTAHHNIVRLVGFCWEVSQRLLVYDYVEKGSLDRWIFVRESVAPDDDTYAALGAPFLDWKTRYSVALGIARGLHYLHEECQQPILHFDIKPQNILLDNHFVAKLADFGMSRLIGRDMSAVVTGMRGTPGYIAPEWSSHGTVSKKSDVYSMGMVLLEIVGGRKNLDFLLLSSSSDPVEQEAWHFPSWAARKCEQGLTMELVDKRLHASGFDVAQALKLIHIVFWSIQEDPTRRPNSSTIVQWLEGSSVVEQPPFSGAVNAGRRPNSKSVPISFIS